MNRWSKFVLASSLLVASCGGGSDASDTSAATAVPSTRATTTQAPTTEAVTTQAATTSPPTTAPADTSDDGPAVIEVIGLDEAFNVREIAVTAGEPVTLVFNNKDTSGEPHNIHVQAGDMNWLTLVAEAPDIQELVFTIDEPGTYPFWCDTHPVTMTGNVVVSEP